MPQVEIPEGKLGVRIRMYGEDLPAGELIAWKENAKGHRAEVLHPGRYPINAIVVTDGQTADTAARGEMRQNYAEIIELHDPVTIPAGFKGLMTDLTATCRSKPNELLSSQGRAGRADRDAWSRARTI